MVFEFACSDCGKLIRVTHELIGRRAKCPGCQTALTIPDPSPGAAVPILDVDLIDDDPTDNDQQKVGQPNAGLQNHGIENARHEAPLDDGELEDNGLFDQSGHSSQPAGMGALDQSDLIRLAKRNWPVPYLLTLLATSLWIGRTGVINFASGDSVNIGAFAAILACSCILLGLYGVAARNFRDIPAIKWTELHLGKVLIAISVLYLLGTSIGALFSAKQLGTSVGMVAGMLVVQWGIVGLIMLVSWKLYEKFGFFNVTLGNLTCAVAVCFLAAISLRGIAAGLSGPLADLSATRDAVATAVGRDKDTSITPSSLRVAGSQLDDSQLPRLPSFREVEAGVEFAEVVLDVGADQSGRNSKLFLYRPSNVKGKIPCVFIAPAGAVPLAGQRLGDGGSKEHVPYVKAGYAVVAYEIDGHMSDMDTIDTKEFAEAVDHFIAAKAGVVNGANAIEYAKQRMQFVDGNQFFTAGHSSAGTAALLLAQHHPLIKGCMAYAAASDLEAALESNGANYYEASVVDLSARLKLCSPLTHARRLKCPVYLFHTQKDSVVTVQDSLKLAAAIDDAGGEVKEYFPAGSDHYGDMIERGIPAAIRWLDDYAEKTADATRVDSVANLDHRGEQPFPSVREFDEPSGSAEKSSPKDGNQQTIEQILDCIKSHDRTVSQEALRELADVRPADVESMKLKKRIAAAYKDLAFGQGVQGDRVEGVRGIVRWGGKHSVPLLVKLLDERLLQTEVFEHLGRLKDPRAARPVANLLADFTVREAAYQCLLEMGPAAETVVMEVAPTSDPEISMAAINLLAEIGTERCLPLLRKAAAKGRLQEIRKRAKSAITKVRKRASEQKAE